MSEEKIYLKFRKRKRKDGSVHNFKIVDNVIGPMSKEKASEILSHDTRLSIFRPPTIKPEDTKKPEAPDSVQEKVEVEAENKPSIKYIYIYEKDLEDKISFSVSGDPAICSNILSEKIEKCKAEGYIITSFSNNPEDEKPGNVKREFIAEKKKAVKPEKKKKTKRKKAKKKNKEKKEEEK